MISILDCHTTLTGFGGVIESPNFLGEYRQGLTCLWDIIVNQGNQINITFSHFESDHSTNKSCDSDYVEVGGRKSYQGADVLYF